MDDKNYVIDSRTLETTVPELIGGKATNLAKLSASGQNVPVWYVIPTLCMEYVFEQNKLFGKIEESFEKLAPDSSPGIIKNQVSVIQDKIRRIQIPDDIIELIRKKHLELIPEDQYFSVRSSAVDEDRSSASFAGLYDSFLFVKNFDELQEKIKAVWASLINTRAISFRLQNNISLSRTSIAVIVQKMIFAQKSGIVFTANPNNGNMQELVISSLYGAGEGVVTAGFDADLFIYSKQQGKYTGHVTLKKEQMVLDEEKKSGLKKITVEKRLQDKPSLTKSQVNELASISIDIENFYERPQDIEFSIDKDGKIFILQTRPITTVEEYGPAAGNRIIWDNSNIIESYSGPTSPMTFSFIRHAYTIVYHCFSNVMGISPKKIQESRHVFENMLGLIKGRVYYNIINWYKLVQLFPGFNYNKAFMESMMGLSEKVDFDDKNRGRFSFTQKYFVELPKLIRLLCRSIYNFSRIDKLVAKFRDHFERHYSQWHEMDFNSMPPDKLMQVYREMETTFLWNWETPIINDFYVMIFYGSLKRRCMRWCNDKNGSLQNDLICGEGNIESTRPTKLLIEIALIIKNNETYLETFTAKTPDELAALIPNDAQYDEIARKIYYYLDKYGFRCINELKLEEPSLKETPQFVYQIIQNYLKMNNALNPALMEQRERNIRKNAEKKADEELSKKISCIPKKRLFRWILRNARRGVRNRENMRFARTKIYGLLRELINAVGKRFEQEGIIEMQHDIYFLTIDEVWDYIKGTSVTTYLKGLINIRKKEFAQYNMPDTQVPDDHFETYGIAYHRNLFKKWKTDTGSGKINGLKGIGCSPGKVTEKIRIVKSPRDDLSLNGEILVAGRTDPGWVPLYPSVSGILIERGSILSHSAIVAREMGIPTIVGIPNLLKALQDGQTVTMDGNTGELIIH